MDAFLMLLGGIVGIGLGAGCGYLIGGRLPGGRPVWFWLTGLGLLLAGVAIAFLGLQISVEAVWVGGVGFIGGGLTGLKYGAGRVPGIGGAG